MDEASQTPGSGWIFDPRAGWGDLWPFDQLIAPTYEVPITTELRHHRPATLDTYPFLIPSDQVTAHQVGNGYGYDVFDVDGRWVVKLAARRHPSVVAPSFLDKQAKSYLFLLSYLGVEYVCPTLLFRFVMAGHVSSCEVQPYIPGAALGALSDADLLRDRVKRSQLKEMIERILAMYEKSKQMPDLFGGAYRHVWMRRAPVILRSARYTDNIRFDDHGVPRLIDVGAWPEGFWARSNMHAWVRCHKLAYDLLRLLRRLESWDRNA